jgi:hypothetical protein
MQWKNFNNESFVQCCVYTITLQNVNFYLGQNDFSQSFNFDKIAEMFFSFLFYVTTYFSVYMIAQRTTKTESQKRIEHQGTLYWNQIKYHQRRNIWTYILI